MSNIQYRLLTIVVLIAASIWSLWPRTVSVREQVGGVFHDTSYTRVPLKRGLDLQGGIHLALE
ncbi:MAG TPA: hypothetical protein VIC55_00280, partial [Gemmatimonadaceae bacterium]